MYTTTEGRIVAFLTPFSRHDSAKEPYIFAKEPNISTEEPYIYAKEALSRCTRRVLPYISAKELYITTKEPYISAKKPLCRCTRQRKGIHYGVVHDNGRELYIHIR